MTDELAIIKAAYANCVSDLARAKAALKQAEDTLYALSQILIGNANHMQSQRIDNPGSGGSGGDDRPVGVSGAAHG
jgi:hypothetical protein